MSRLSYRTVFDVDAKPGESVIDAWAAGRRRARGGWSIRTSWRRFHETYRGIPPLPAEYADAREPFVVPPVPVGRAGG